jgi:hypothetical protein
MPSNHPSAFLGKLASSILLNTMFGAVPADLEITLAAAVDPPIFVATQIAFGVPSHAAIEALEVMLMPRLMLAASTTSTTTVAVLGSR